MLYDLDITRVLFLDIETVPAVYRYEDLDERARGLWDTKCGYMIRDGGTAEEAYAKAGIFAEFGRIVCISVGFIQERAGERTLRIKSFSDVYEEVLLGEFAEMLRDHFGKTWRVLCAHNGKEFDFPYIARRMLINGLPVPAPLATAGMKPWEVPHLDTLELWKFGDRKNFTSLDLLVHVFGIPSPKGDISGADVGRVFWEDEDLDRIVTYCEKDVVAIAQLLLRYRGEDLIPDDRVVVVE